MIAYALIRSCKTFWAAECSRLAARPDEERQPWRRGGGKESNGGKSQYWVKGTHGGESVCASRRDITRKSYGPSDSAAAAAGHGRFRSTRTEYSWDGKVFDDSILKIAV